MKIDGLKKMIVNLSNVCMYEENVKKYEEPT